MGGLESGGSNKTSEDRDAARQASLDAIREGRALPTPDFAVQEGQEMITLLTHEIQHLDANQLDGLRNNLADLSARSNAELGEALEDPSPEDRLLSWLGTNTIYGFILGNIVSPGIGGAVGAAVGSIFQKVINQDLGHLEQ
jgi:hypothetical protein